QQEPERIAALLGSRSSYFRRSVCECAVVRGEVVERQIFGADKTQLFQIRVRELPPAALVNPCAMRQYASGGVFGRHLPDAFDLGIEHPLLAPIAIGSREPQGRLQAASEFVFR